jgi:N6-L-threonylcarbamoyladenine synthase
VLGLAYPGGPEIDKRAALGNKTAFKFNIPRIAEFDFSFSGLKTSILYFIRDSLKDNPNFINDNLNDLCASVQYSIVQILISKLEKAILKTNIKHVALAGGVSANSALRTALFDLGVKHNLNIYIPKFEYCTDNAAMVAVAGYYKFINEKFSNHKSSPFAR